MKKSALLLTLALTATMFFTACGGNTEAPSDESAQTPPTTNELATTEQAHSEESEVPAPSPTEQRIKMTLDDKDVAYATLYDGAGAKALVENLPLTIDMTDYISRNKRGSLPFTVEDDQLHIVYPFETGDIIYYPPGPLLGIFYDHNGAEISAGYELVAKLDDEGIKTFATYPENVKVTIELSE